MRFNLLARPAKRVPRPRPSFVPRLTALEDRAVPSTFLVKDLSDGGADSLRAAITAANANPDHDVIQFAPGLQGVITLTEELRITEDLAIAGPGAGKVTVSGAGAYRVFHVS